MRENQIPDMYTGVRTYIKNSWGLAVKKKDVDKGFPLPYDYIPPCIEGDLTNLYYWDTYFTNLGLYSDGLNEYALNNIEDLKYCLRKFGCVPNMCRLNGADFASQPPLLFMMVADYFKYTNDLDFLNDSYEALCREYHFWQTKRIAPNGLSKYGTNQQDKAIMISFDEFFHRTNLDGSALSEKQKIEIFYNRVAEGESGEDHTPRFKGRANEVNPVDLNCYLYMFEKKMASFSIELGKMDESAIWKQRMTDRNSKIIEFCYDNETGIFFDYNFVTNQKSHVVCSACYLPYIAGLTSDRQALDSINNQLLLPHGVASCSNIPTDGLTCQWGYPNVWAPHNFMAYNANKKVNKRIAAEIAKRYLNTIATEFAKSGKLYEKYDGLVGGVATLNEYGTPEMLGWTAGDYNYLFDELYG